MLLNTIGYDPIDEGVSATGFIRPPKNIPAICDYFAALMEIEDNGKFLHQEMSALLRNPDKFFSSGARSV